MHRSSLSMAGFGHKSQWEPEISTQDDADVIKTDLQSTAHKDSEVKEASATKTKSTSAQKEPLVQECPGDCDGKCPVCRMMQEMDMQEEESKTTATKKTSKTKSTAKASPKDAQDFDF
jgi:phage FluMu protein Com